LFGFEEGVMRNLEMEGILSRIAHDNPGGLACAGFVKEVLLTGYKHVANGDSTLSGVVHTTIKYLCSEGVLRRSEDDEGRRAYHQS